jgi:chromosome segregation ATPase
MNISVYLNDGEVISSVDINEATVEEALSAIKSFGFGENKEEWLYSDNQKIRYRVEDSDKIRIQALQEDRDKIFNELIELKGLYKDRVNELLNMEFKLKSIDNLTDECEEWKEKYKIECQHNDEIKMANDVLVNNFRILVKERDEYKEIASDRDDLKIALDQANDYVTAVEKSRDQLISDCETLRNELNEYKEIASDRDDLKIENDKVKELCEMLQNEKDELERKFKLVREDYFKANHQVSELIGENDNLKKENEKLKKESDLYVHYLKKILFDRGYSDEAMTFLKVMERKKCQEKKSES